MPGLSSQKIMMISSEWFNQLARTRRSVFPGQFKAGEKINDNIKGNPGPAGYIVAKSN